MATMVATNKVYPFMDEQVQVIETNNELSKPRYSLGLPSYVPDPCLQNKGYIDYALLTYNNSPEAMLIFEQFIILQRTKNVEHGRSFYRLSLNPYAIYLFAKNAHSYSTYDVRVLDGFSWYELSENPSAVHILHNEHRRPRIYQVNYAKNTNPLVIERIKNLIKTMNPGRYAFWKELSGNPAAIQILRKYPKFIDWHELSGNESREAIQMLESNPTKINWFRLSSNRYAAKLIKENLDKVDWFEICGNQCNSVLRLLRKRPNSINWYKLSTNPASEAIKLIEENLDKVDWFSLHRNSSAIHLLFKLDYNAMMRNMFESGIAEELAMRVNDPDRLARIAERNKMEFIDVVAAYAGNQYDVAEYSKVCKYKTKID